MELSSRATSPVSNHLRRASLAAYIRQRERAVGQEIGQGLTESVLKRKAEIIGILEKQFFSAHLSSYVASESLRIGDDGDD